jgi:hypothetical protein
MCQSLKVNATWAAKYAATLRQRTGLGDIIEHITGFPFEGFIRNESIESGVWDHRITKKGTYIEIDGFSERNHTTGEVHYFPRKGRIRVEVVNGFRGYKESRIVTEPAQGEIKKIHGRQPKFFDERDK